MLKSSQLEVMIIQFSSHHERADDSYDYGTLRQGRQKETLFGDIQNGLRHLHGSHYICIQGLKQSLTLDCRDGRIVD